MKRVMQEVYYIGVIRQFVAFVIEMYGKEEFKRGMARTGERAAGSTGAMGAGAIRQALMRRLLLPGCQRRGPVSAGQAGYG